MSRALEIDLASFLDDDGKLGRAIPSGKIVVPEKVWLEGDTIRWELGAEASLKEVSRNMLNQFIRLRDVESILRFAKRWGVLALSGTPLRPAHPTGRGGAEPIVGWQYYSRRASALLNVAAALKQGKLGDLNDWGEFALFLSKNGVTQENEKWMLTSAERHVFGCGFRVIGAFDTSEERLDYAREVVVHEIQDWLDTWKVGKSAGISDFSMNWNIDRECWNLEIDYHGFLFPAIAYQLALVIAGADSLYTCSGCGNPYSRPRERKRPKSGWNNYCQECANSGVATQKAVKLYREKKSNAARLHFAGVPIPAIAKQLGTEVSRVRGWLKERKDVKAKARK